MNTIKTMIPVEWEIRPAKHSLSPVKQYLAYCDSQKKYRTLWWFVNLMVHGNLVLAVPAVLIYYYNAPIYVLAVTVVLFFTNLIVNMGGSGIRITLTAFFASLIINTLMLMIYIL